jgi:hypothetical protein
MSGPTLRRLWFAGLWLLWPWPLVIFADAFVPAARYALLAAAAAAVALHEGAAGPVGMIVALLVGMALVTTAGCWVLAFVVARVLAYLPRRASVVLTLLLLGIGLVVALVSSPYRMPFGRAPYGGLLEVLS